jgi:hypothetical protein
LVGVAELCSDDGVVRVESTMSVNNTVASTRSSGTSAWWPVRNSAISWEDGRHGSATSHMLRPGNSTYFAPDM